MPKRYRIGTLALAALLILITLCGCGSMDDANVTARPTTVITFSAATTTGDATVTTADTATTIDTTMESEEITAAATETETTVVTTPTPPSTQPPTSTTKRTTTTTTKATTKVTTKTTVSTTVTRTKTTTAATAAPTADNAIGHKVYKTPTGKRYHYDPHCNGGTYIECTYEEAIALGLTPCKKCVK